MLLSLLPVNILMFLCLFSFKCCGEANAAAALGASESEVVGFHGTHFSQRKLVVVERSGNCLPQQEEDAPRASGFVSTGDSLGKVWDLDGRGS